MDKKQLLQEGYREARYISSKENKTYIFNDYFVNREGEVFSFRTNKILDGNFFKGYKRYCLHTIEKGKNKKIVVGVHVLIASTFFEETNINNIEDENTFQQVHHINHNHNDNKPENLLWISKVEHDQLHGKSDITRKRMSNSLKGKTLSDITRQKMSEAKTGENHPMFGRAGAEHPRSKPVIAFTNSGSYYQEFAGTKDAERKLGINQSAICKCCKGKQKSAGKYNGEKLRWKYKES